MDFCRVFVFLLRMNIVKYEKSVIICVQNNREVKQCEDTFECIKKRLCVCLCTCLPATPSKLALTKAS